MESPRRAAIYCRISDDREGERLGVQRQEQDLQREARHREAQVVAVLVDNDLSGRDGVHRPDYERLIEMIQQREVEVVLAWDLDRLTRGLRNYVRLYDACEAAGIQVGWLGGTADFTSGAGIFEMELRSTFAREELRKMRARSRRKHLELAATGKDNGGGRPFGYEEDRRTVRPVEAALVREARDRALVGEPLRSICRDWMTRGIPTVIGGSWRTTVLKRILCSARISGRRERKVGADGKVGIMGAITCDHAVYEAIISPEESDRLRSVLGHPDRRVNGSARSYLLTGGIARCGLCGKGLVARPKDDHRRCYVCASGPNFGGCGKIRILADTFESFVSDVVLRRIDSGAVQELLCQKEDRATADELLLVKEQLSALALEWAERRLDMEEWRRARESLVAQQDRLSARLEAGRRTYGLDALPTPLGLTWTTLSLHRRRAVIAAVLEAVVVRPAVKGLNRFDPGRLSFRWRA